MKCCNFEFLPMCDLPISENHHFLNITSHGLVPAFSFQMPDPE